MRLFELTDADPLDVRLVAVMSQIKSDVDRNPGKKWNLPQLLMYLRKQDINLGGEADQGEMLRSLINKPPLNNFIQNIQGDEVIFKDQGGELGDADPMKKKDTVKAMAKSALTR